MATHTPSTPPLKPHRDPQRWDPSNVRVRYDRREDMLYIHALPLVPAGGRYAGPHDELLLLIADDGQELVGAQIENFRAVWLKSHPEVEASFREVTRPIISRWLRTAWSNFTRVIVNSVTQEAGLAAPPSTSLP